MGQTNKVSNQLQRNLIAAAWEEKDSDKAYKSFTRLMLSRARIAKDLLKTTDEKKQELLQSMLDYYNENIKNILGL